MSDEMNDEVTGKVTGKVPVRTKKLKSNKLNLRIADEELEMLNNMSFEENESVSQVVRKAIRTYNALRRNKNDFEY